MDKSVFDIFWGVRNSLVAGFFWTVGLYLCFGPLVSWWLTPMAQASPVITHVVSGLGAPGLTVVALMAMALSGGVIVRTSSASWLMAHRRLLMYILHNVDSIDSARLALNELTSIGRFFRTYSNRALTRLIEEFLRQRANASAISTSPSDVRTMASNVIFMAPSLIGVSEKRFAEQQKANARWELATASLLGLPLIICAATANLTTDFLAGAPGYVLALVSACFALVDAQQAWRERNSQIAHALVDQKSDLSGISQNRDVSRGLKTDLPYALGRLFTRDHSHGSDSPIAIGDAAMAESADPALSP